MQLSTRSIVRLSGAGSTAVDVHWAELGQGPPVVLIHGLSDSLLTWSRVAPLLAHNHRVLMLDLPGHGLSGRPDAGYELAWHAKIVGQWLDGLGIEQADVIGHSYGGGVAQWLLLERRERVRRIGLVAAGGLGRDVSWSLRLAAIPRVVEALGQPFMRIGTEIGLRSLGATYNAAETAALGWMNSRPGSARALARTVRDVIALSGQRRHFLDRADEVAELPPLHLFWGTRDPVIPIAHATTLLDRVEGASLTTFDGCGHFPHRERPIAFVNAVRALIEPESATPARVRRVYALGAVGRPSWIRRAWRSVIRCMRALLTAARGAAYSPK
jgi:pimeloyl-ACP methyl ester carboxylesterase